MAVNVFPIETCYINSECFKMHEHHEKMHEEREKWTCCVVGKRLIGID